MSFKEYAEQQNVEFSLTVFVNGKAVHHTYAYTVESLCQRAHVQNDYANDHIKAEYEKLAEGDTDV